MGKYYGYIKWPHLLKLAVYGKKEKLNSLFARKGKKSVEWTDNHFQFTPTYFVLKNKTSAQFILNNNLQKALLKDCRFRFFTE